MGCNEVEDDLCAAGEKPFHKIMLKEFLIDKYEVSMRDYQKCVEDGACAHHWNDETCHIWNGKWGKGVLPQKYRDASKPVMCVDWSQAGKYCKWAGKRLPTEAEWEKSARGNNAFKYAWGNKPEPGCGHAVMASEKGAGCGAFSTSPIGTKPYGMSPYGVMDLAGNAWEWVSDWFDEKYYNDSPEENPAGPVTGERRVVRGGGWIDRSLMEFRASRRLGINPADSGNDIGFRCAADK